LSNTIEILLTVGVWLLRSWIVMVYMTWMCKWTGSIKAVRTGFATYTSKCSQCRRLQVI